MLIALKYFLLFSFFRYVSQRVFILKSFITAMSPNLYNRGDRCELCLNFPCCTIALLRLLLNFFFQVVSKSEIASLMFQKVGGFINLISIILGMEGKKFTFNFFILRSIYSFSLQVIFLLNRQIFGKNMLNMVTFCWKPSFKF